MSIPTNVHKSTISSRNDGNLYFTWILIRQFFLRSWGFICGHTHGGSNKEWAQQSYCWVRRKCPTQLGFSMKWFLWTSSALFFWTFLSNYMWHRWHAYPITGGPTARHSFKSLSVRNSVHDKQALIWYQIAPSFPPPPKHDTSVDVAKFHEQKVEIWERGIYHKALNLIKIGEDD